jgi:tRNA G10  N-methylase Trm11
VAVTISIVLAFLLLKQCNQPPVVFTGKKAIVDSMNAIHDKYVDSVYRETLARDVEIKELRDSLSVSRTEARKWAANASEWITKYKQAREQHDTVTMIYSCDSIVMDHEAFLEANDIAWKQADSVMSKQFEQIQSLKDINTKQADHIKFQYTVITEQESQIKDLTKALVTSEKREKKKRFWAKVGSFVTGAGAGIITGVLISK